MPCISIQASDWVDEHGECGDCEAKHAMVPAMIAPVEDPSSSSLLQMVAAVEVVLKGIGEDVEREGLLKTPLRVASAFQGAISGYQLSAKEIVGAALFSEAGTSGGTGCGGGSGGIVVVRDIDSFALCESCLLPFRLRCHVAYIPSGQRVVGLSKLPRVAEIFAKRLQNPQKFADEVVQALNESFRPLGVGMVVETWHLEWPGVCDSNGLSTGRNGERLGFGWVPVSVYAGEGQFGDLQSCLWDEFLAILQLQGIDIDKLAFGATDGLSGRKKSCPFLVYDGQGVSSSEVSYNVSLGLNSVAGITTISASAATMAVGLESLMRVMGGDPNKEELRSTALRFVNWILSATQGSRGSLSNGQDHGLRGSVKGAIAQCNNNGLSNYTNGLLAKCSSNDSGLKGCSVSAFSIQCNGLGSSNAFLSNGFAVQSHGSAQRLSDEMLGHGGSALNDHGATGISNGVVRCGYGTVSDINCTTSSGTLLKLDVIYGVDNYTEGLVSLELDMTFTSLCEHHLLPFFGIVHVAYVCGNGSRQIDRSLVAKIVRIYSRRLQVQERFTRQIAEAVVSCGSLQGAMVVAEASHMCIMSRGVEKLGSTTATVATIGKFSSDGGMRAAFLKRISRKAAKNVGNSIN